MVEGGGLSIKEHDGDSYVPLHELSRWIDESGKKDVTLKNFMKSCPEYGILLEGSRLIHIKYLPYLVRSFWYWQN